MGHVHSMAERIWLVLLIYNLSFYYSIYVPGDIVYGYTMGQHVIVLNSLKVVTDLFDKRSHIYSDRPLLPMRDMCVYSLSVEVS